MMDAERAREVLAEALPGAAWSDLRANILDGSCRFHSDPENWIASAALAAIAQAHAAGRAEGLEEAAEIAGMDADWVRFSLPKSVDQWEDGPNGARDYRAGIAAGATIAAAIRARITTTGGGE